MAHKILHWFVEGEQGSIKQNIGGNHVLDADCRPLWVYLSLRKTTKGDRPLKVDITADGVSIFDDKPALVEGQSEKTWTTVSQNVLRENSVLKLNRDQIASIYPGEDLTVELALEEV